MYCIQLPSVHIAVVITNMYLHYSYYYSYFVYKQ